jgi:hypothetical protein
MIRRKIMSASDNQVYGTVIKKNVDVTYKTMKITRRNGTVEEVNWVESVK